MSNTGPSQTGSQDRDNLASQASGRIFTQQSERSVSQATQSPTQTTISGRLRRTDSQRTDSQRRGMTNGARDQSSRENVHERAAAAAADTESEPEEILPIAVILFMMVAYLLVKLQGW